MKIKEIAKEFNLDPITARVLYSRGYKRYDEIDDFMNPDLENLYNPEEFTNIRSVKDKILSSIEFEDNITIWTDYDVDGITSGAVLYMVLKELGANVNAYIGDRYMDGYGLSYSGLNHIKTAHDTDLLITVDCGIAESEKIEYAKEELNINTIVVDHHEYEKNDKPDCLFIDSKVNGTYPFKELSACGVTWKLCQYLTERNLYKYLDLVALSTIADVVDLVGENRIIAEYGLKRINTNNCNLGIQKLIELQELNDVEITSGHIGFQIAPPINALGRLGKATKAFELLITDDEDEAYEIADLLIKNNKDRQKETEKALQEVEEKIDLSKKVLVAKGNFKAGIVGIVASKIKDKYNKPAFVINENNKGSCRSVAPLNIYKLLKTNESYLKNYGGHAFAGGFKIKDGEYENFKRRLEVLLTNVNYNEVKHDFYCNTNELSMDLVEDLNKLRPFGKGNPRPKFKSNVEFQSVRVIGKNKKHLKFVFDDNIDAIGFNLVGDIKECKHRNMIIIYSPDINEFRGKRNLQLNVYYIKGLRKHDTYKKTQRVNQSSL